MIRNHGPAVARGASTEHCSGASFVSNTHGSRTDAALSKVGKEDSLGFEMVWGADGGVGGMFPFRSCLVSFHAARGRRNRARWSTAVLSARPDVTLSEIPGPCCGKEREKKS